jgi:hypothetical protein
MDNQNGNLRVTIKPEEDARLPILEARIGREWRQFRKAFVKELIKDGMLERAVKDTALQCVRVLHEYQNAGHNPDQGREAIIPLIRP